MVSKIVKAATVICPPGASQLEKESFPSSKLPLSKQS